MSAANHAVGKHLCNPVRTTVQTAPFNTRRNLPETAIKGNGNATSPKVRSISLFAPLKGRRRSVVGPL